MKTSHALPPDKTYVLSLHEGDKVQASILSFCRERSIISASYTGLGAVADVLLSHYSVKHKKYTDKKMSGPFELLNITGNVGNIYNGDEHCAMFAHSHVTLSDESCACFGGHLQEAVVYAVVELFIQAYTQTLIRKKRRRYRAEYFDITYCWRTRKRGKPIPECHYGNCPEY